MTLIREHDPFSGHRPEVPPTLAERAQAALEQVGADQPASEPQPAVEVITDAVPEFIVPVPPQPAPRRPRGGGRRRRKPTAAEVQDAVRKMDT